MTETSWLAIIAVCNAVCAILAFATLVLAKFTRDDVKITRDDIKTLEVNTNSIKDALVARTAEASEAKGRDDQRAISEERASFVALGRGEARLDMKQAQAGPVPVTDSRTAKAAESTAASTEKLADATVKIANAAEKKK